MSIGSIVEQNQSTRDRGTQRVGGKSETMYWRSSLMIADTTPGIGAMNPIKEREHASHTQKLQQ